jgi:D-lactate dehydrogenase
LATGVFIINTARGSLIDTNELIKPIEDKKVGGVALDVIENDTLWLDIMKI